MPGVNENLRSVNIPELNRRTVYETYLQGLLGLAEIPLIDKVVNILRSPEFEQMVESGHISFAMVKPKLDESSVLSNDYQDPEIAEVIIREIKPPLEVVFQASFVFTDDMIEEFYGGFPKERQLTVEPLDPNRYGQEHNTRWDEFKALMKQGPVTGLILFSEAGNAVSEWRNQMGNDWRMVSVKKKYPDSLRARFGLSNHNNLLHGSDSIQSVKNEVAFFTKALKNMSHTG